MNSASVRGALAVAPRRVATDLREVAVCPDVRCFAVGFCAAAFRTAAFFFVTGGFPAGFFAAGFLTVGFADASFFAPGRFAAGFFAACLFPAGFADAAIFAPRRCAIADFVAGFLFTVFLGAGLLRRALLRRTHSSNSASRSETLCRALPGFAG